MRILNRQEWSGLLLQLTDGRGAVGPSTAGLSAAGELLNSCYVRLCCYFLPLLLPPHTFQTAAIIYFRHYTEYKHRLTA